MLTHHQKIVAVGGIVIVVLTSLDESQLYPSSFPIGDDGTPSVDAIDIASGCAVFAGQFGSGTAPGIVSSDGFDSLSGRIL